jgi:hypothetical protein
MCCEKASGGLFGALARSRDQNGARMQTLMLAYALALVVLGGTVAVIAIIGMLG